MTDERIDREDRAILAAIEALESGRVSGPTFLPEESPEDRALEREYHELLGLIPEQIEPIEPSPEARERLMAALPKRSAAGPGEARPKESAGRSAEVRPFRSAASATGSTRRGAPPFAWAAGIALFALALAGWLAFQLADQSAQLARTEELLAQEVLARSIGDERLSEISQRLVSFTAPGTQVCLMYPTGEAPPQPEARGALFMSEVERAWYIQARDLEPAPDGMAYVLWALAEGDAMPLGRLAMDDDREAIVQWAADALPDYDMTGVAVTLEDPAALERPTGPVLLYGARADMFSL
ncbi:MAG: anti-sigma factor [Acidobacteriota bacterium]